MRERDFYKQPHSPEPEPEGRRGSSVKAVLYGLAVDVAGGFALRTILALVLALTASATLTPTADGAEGLSGDTLGLLILVASIVANVCMSILGGFVCARFSMETIRRDASILALVSGTLALAAELMGVNLLLALIITAGTMGGVAYGAWLGARSLRRPSSAEMKA